MRSPIAKTLVAVLLLMQCWTLAARGHSVCVSGHESASLACTHDQKPRQPNGCGHKHEREHDAHIGHDHGATSHAGCSHGDRVHTARHHHHAAPVDSCDDQSNAPERAPDRNDDQPSASECCSHHVRCCVHLFTPDSPQLARGAAPQSDAAASAPTAPAVALPMAWHASRTRFAAHAVCCTPPPDPGCVVRQAVIESTRLLI